jgi:hypothetical protein
MLLIHSRDQWRRSGRDVAVQRASHQRVGAETDERGGREGEYRSNY